MKKSTSLLVIGILCMFGLFVTSAMAHEFTASTKSGTAKDTNKYENTTHAHVFITNGGEVTCKEVKSTEPITSTKTKTVKANVKYTECTAFGFVGAEISEAEYEFSAEGSVKVLNTITIKPKGLGCEVKVGPQGPLTKITYTEKSPNVEVNSEVGNIAYTSSGGLCGSSGTNGKYKGPVLVSLEGGKVGFV